MTAGGVGRLVATVRRLGWGVADQGVSSLSNFALGVVAAKSLDPAGFGAFTLAYLTYAFVLSAARGPSTDPLMVRFSYAEPTVWRRRWRPRARRPWPAASSPALSACWPASCCPETWVARSSPWAWASRA